MAGLVLSREEVREVTGCAQRALQRQHLDALGIPYQVNAEGWPVVLRSRAIEVLGGSAANDEAPREATLYLGEL
ncbi:protein of unknown function [Halomonas shengliensis]|uniref:DUF4224 domain-containing protein n=1 Tax=Halomonas shengliensis TaxID=419597 RepID=A0A1H0IAJ9_9GAMM|nr:DUF4224 domain-containing protein [Halomonas shengliensis]SDO28386.1 protein of unknown function [Halomonas shengliensis]